MTRRKQEAVLYGLSREQRSAPITVNDIMTLRHMLGMQHGAAKAGRRNYYAAHSSGNWPHLQRLEQAGLILNLTPERDRGVHYYRATEAGMVIAGLQDAKRWRLVTWR